MFIKLIFGLAVALVSKQVVADVPNKAMEKVEVFLQNRIAGDSPEDLGHFVDEFTKENRFMTRQNAGLFMDPLTSEILRLLVELHANNGRECEARNFEHLVKLDNILGQRACKPKLSDGNLLERILHQTCLKWAKECASTFKHKFIKTFDQTPSKIKTEKRFDIFLMDSNSEKPKTLEAKMEQVEQNLNGPEAGHLLALIMYNQMSWEERNKAMHDIDASLDETYDLYIIKPCLYLLKTVPELIEDHTQYELKLDDLKNSAFYDALNRRYVCLTVTEKKAEYIEKIRETVKASLQ